MVFTPWFLFSCSHKLIKTEAISNPDKFIKPASVDSEPLFKFNYEKDEINQLCTAQINGVKSKLKSWQTKFMTNESDIKALLEFESIMADYSDVSSPLTFISKVSLNEGLRAESSQCQEKSETLLNEILTTKDYYKILKQVKAVTAADLRLLKETLTQFEMKGMSLNDEDLKKFKTLADRLSQLSTQFDQNLDNDTSTISLSAQELSGVKEDFLARLKKDEHGNFIVTTKTPDYLHVMENASSSETRKKMMFAYNNRQAEKNTPIMQEAIQVRSDMGKLMNFTSFADYALQDKMAGNSKAVFNFLNDLKSKLTVKNKKEMTVLAEFKKKELNDSALMAAWDILYLSNQLKIQKYKVDQDLVKEYFPASYVIPSIMEIYSHLLGVEFRQIKSAPVWASNVELYEVSDADSKKVIAYFYSDLIPREGKYGHAAAFGLIGGRQREDGDYQTPVASIVANFSPPAPGKPILLTHNEIEIFFHEFGHIMHLLLTKVPYQSLSGFNVKHDFAEAPSQMLENWAWDATVLKKISQHYLDPKKKIPTDLVNRLQKLRLFNSGITSTRQLVFGFFDMKIHTDPKVDITQAYAQLQKELTGFPPIEGTHFPATFGHLMHGYEAGYYGYLWSKVYAEDMFSVFEKKGILNSQLGHKYRRTILEQGNLKDPLVLIKNFLGREPNNKAFFKSLGI
ncbi:Zn-dependent oligopeptidase [Candidatus Peregrinibacteria bacterium]|nr:Zn-dependent oligopeptidase [Candidatus Peregrinibacteria bacterium]